MAWMLALSCGCYRAQVRNDGNQVRGALLDMYTDQAMDNLIRAYLNLPFIQLNYHDLLVQATDQYTGTLSNAQMFSANRGYNIASTLALSALRTVGTTFTFGGTAQRQELLSFKADPITDQNDIYDKYLEFVKNPSYFQVADKPPPFAVHLVRKYNGCYYFIPCEAAQPFLQLILGTTLQRGKVTTPLGVYPVTILSATVTSKVDTSPNSTDDSVNVNLQVDSKVPNGRGLLVIKVGDRLAQLRISLNQAFGDGAFINILQTQFSPTAEGFGPNALTNLKGNFYSTDHPPELSRPDQTLTQIKENLDLIRANQSIKTLSAPLTP